MAESLDDGEFWLPPQFLADDDDQHTSPTTKNTEETPLASSAFHSRRALFPLDFGTFGGFSDFSSSGETLKSSSETESDEEDLVAGLTLRVARSAIDDGFDPDNAKGRVFAGSPQSTLFDMGSGSGCSQGSSRGSPKGNCKVPSPPATWDLLHAAAGEVAKMRVNESHGVVHQNRAIPQVAVPAKNSSTGTGFFQQLQQKEIMHRQKQIHQMVQNEMRGRRGLPSSSWLPPPQCSGARSLFAGIPGGKRECAGTGVFLPRNTGTQSEQRRKPGCSTVMVPARVMQALNLNIDDICRQPHLQPVAAERFNSENDVLLRLQINRGANYQKRISRRQPPTDHEIKLPQEWTY